MQFGVEVELNREWLYAENDSTEPVGETNFVVALAWCKKIFDESFVTQYACFEDFLSAYVPEIDGQFLYSKALAEGAIVEDLGKVYY